MENKPASLLVVSLGKALNGTPPPLCGRQVAPPVLHRIIIVRLLTQHVRRLLGTHQWQSALLVVGLPVTQDWFEMGCHLSPSPGVAKLFMQSANSSTNPCRMRHKCRAGVANLFSPCAKIFRHTSIHLKMRHTNIHSISLNV